MSVQRRKRCGFIRNENGFTYIEMMVALIIVSLVGVIIWQGIANAGKLLDKITVHSSSTVKLMQMEESMRRLIGKVRYPFWVNELEIVDRDDEITIPYYEGKSNTLLVVKYEDEHVIIGTRYRDTEQMDDVKYFGPFSDATIELARNEDEVVIGVSFIMYAVKKSSDPVKITARFGSNPCWIVKTS
jgi:prepilin-type N-terminal cleavage/methylation domain-containing protein